MTSIVRGLIALVVAFAVGMLASRPILSYARKQKLGQTILHYVAEHKDKNGTPTFGGLIFLLPAAAVFFVFADFDDRLAVFSFAVICAFGLLGFLDDFIKVKFKQNRGLRAYQKVIGQVGIAVITALFCYRSYDIGSTVQIPFSDKTIYLGVWYIPIAVLWIVFMTNSVNLTDGLDGLAGQTSAVYVLAFALIILYGLVGDGMYYGQTSLAGEYGALFVLCMCLLGGILAFLWYNHYPATIFMGDTGSMALGACVAVLPLVTKTPFSGFFMGGAFAWSGVSVVLQVASFKLRAKRIFLIAPYHHHLQSQGHAETKIVSYYTILTAVLCAVGLLSVIL